jgi:hypothetical protein
MNQRWHVAKNAKTNGRVGVVVGWPAAQSAVNFEILSRGFASIGCFFLFDRLPLIERRQAGHPAAEI